MDLISVIVPVYNVEKYLEKCIESICSQTYVNMEIILVDDGSVDRSLQICREYQKKDERIKIIQKENGGLVSARKAGVLEAVGDYIGYVDGDDWIEPELYERLLNGIKESDTDLVESDYYIDRNGNAERINSKIGYGSYFLDEIVPIMLCDSDFHEYRLNACVWSKLFRKEKLIDVQLAVDERIGFGEDAAVTYPYVLNCKKILFLNYAGYHYVQRKNSMSNLPYRNELQRDRCLISYLKTVFERSQYAEILKMELNQYAKILLLLRQPSFFDFANLNQILEPFGGIGKQSRVIIYGAGRLGQSLYRYLGSFSSIQIVDWIDRSFAAYQKLGFPVSAPEGIRDRNGQYDFVIIAVISENVVKKIMEFLIGAGVPAEKIIWRTNAFEDKGNDVLEQLCNRKFVAVCGFRKYGRRFYQELLAKGIFVPYIVERNYQALSQLEKDVPPIVGFQESERYREADVIVVTLDMDFGFIKEAMELAGIEVPLLTQEAYVKGEG